MQIINEEVDRIARLVKKLMDLHRPAEANVQPVAVNRIIEEILALVEPDLRQHQISIERRLDPALEQPWASPDLIRQLLINLIRNAQDAMEKGGRLTVETAAEISNGIRIRVIDTGIGIAPEHLGQIFDPFFTTKPEGKGTGLGLCVSYSIVNVYSGTIDVESRPDEGTAVTVILPLGYRRAPPGPAAVVEIGSV